MEPPEPVKAAGRGHSPERARRAPPQAGAGGSRTEGGAAPAARRAARAPGAVEAPEPGKAAGRGHSSESAARALSKAGEEVSMTEAGPAPWSWNSTEQSAGTMARTISRKDLRIASGSCLPTRRKLTLA